MRRGPRDELCRGDGAHHPRVAGRRGRRADHPDHARGPRRAGHQPRRPARQAVADPRHRALPAGDVRPRRARWPARRGSSRSWCGSSWPRSASSRCWCSRGAGVVDVLPVLVGFVTWVAAAARTHRAAAHGRQSHPELESRERRVFLMVAGVLGLAAVGIAGRRPRRRRAVGATSSRAGGCCASTRSRCPMAAGRRLVGPGGRRPVADAQRRLLPDPHGHLGAGDRAQGLAPAHPRASSTASSRSPTTTSSPGSSPSRGSPSTA